LGGSLLEKGAYWRGDLLERGAYLRGD
jgi:hypothetical protein